MPRIAVVTPILPIPADITRGRFIYETAKALSQQAEVKVFLQEARYPRWARRHCATESNAAATVREGITVVEGTYPAIPGLSRISNGLASGCSVLKDLRAFAPDVVIGYWVYPEGAGAIWAARRLGCPVILGALGTDVHMRSGLNAWLTRRTLHQADAVITVSEAMTRHTMAQYGVPADRITTIINGFNATVFGKTDTSDARRELGVDGDSEILVYVGRLIEAKGLKELLISFDQLRKNRKNIQLIFIGEGAFRTTLENIISERGMGEQVRFTGGMPPDAVARWLNAADCLVLPSWSEGYPNVLVEALACGCPVVATRVGGIPEIVNDLNGILVNARDPVDLHHGLMHALTRRWDRSAIAQSMRRSWHDVARETLQVCRTLMPQRAD